jgi:dTDP-4-amino-4,6-dideoxygalactose transaminase
MSYARHIYTVYTIRSADRDGLRAALQQREIQTGIHHPVPVHLQPAYVDLGYCRGDFPMAEQACAEVLALPIYPEMQMEEVVAAVRLAGARKQVSPPV